MIYIADADLSILLLTRRPLNILLGGVNVIIADEQYQVPGDARRRGLRAARFRLSAKSSHASLLLLSPQSLLTLRGTPFCVGPASAPRDTLVLRERGGQGGFRRMEVAARCQSIVSTGGDKAGKLTRNQHGREKSRPAQFE